MSATKNEKFLMSAMCYVALDPYRMIFFSAYLKQPVS
jgi:hypothetical protein